MPGSKKYASDTLWEVTKLVSLGVSLKQVGEFINKYHYLSQ